MRVLEERQRLLQAAKSRSSGGSISGPVGSGSGNDGYNPELDESGMYNGIAAGESQEDLGARVWLEHQLSHISLLAAAGLKPSEYSMLSRAMKCKEYQPGSVILSQGDAVRHLFIIQQGGVECVQRVYSPEFSDDVHTENETPNALPVCLKEEHTRKVATLGKDQAFGEQALLGQSPSPFSVLSVSTGPTVCWTLARRDLVTLLGAERINSRVLSLAASYAEDIPEASNPACPTTITAECKVDSDDQQHHTRVQTTDARLALSYATEVSNIESKQDFDDQADSTDPVPSTGSIIISALLRCPMLRTFSRADILRIAKQMVPVVVRHGEVVIRAGARAFAMYVITSGKVRIYSPINETPLGYPSEFEDITSQPTGGLGGAPAPTPTPQTVQQRLLQRRASLSVTANAPSQQAAAFDINELEKKRQEFLSEDEAFRKTLPEAVHVEFGLESSGGGKGLSLAFRRELGVGDVFGDVAIMLDCPRTATAIARDPGRPLGTPSHGESSPEPSPRSIPSSGKIILWALPRTKLLEALQQHSERTRRLVESCIARVPEFVGLTPDEISRATEALELAHYPKGRCIVREGAPGKTFFIIKSGQVRVVKAVKKEGASGNDMVEGVELGVYGPGEYFGERALLLNQPRQASCIAVTDVECYYLHSMHFNTIFGKARAAMLAKIGISGDQMKSGNGRENHIERAPVIDAKKPFYSPQRPLVRRTSMAFADGTNFGLRGWVSESATHGYVLPHNMTPIVPRTHNRRASLALVPAQVTSSSSLALFSLEKDQALHLLSPGAFLCRDPESWRALLPDHLKPPNFSRDAFKVIAQTFACDLYADYLVCDNNGDGKGYCLRVISRKVFSLLSDRTRKRFAQACAIERSIVHPFLSKVYCAVEDEVNGTVVSPKLQVPKPPQSQPNAVSIIRDFAHAGTIAELLARGYYRGRRVLDDHAARFVIACCILGLEALHAHGIAHRALTPDSLLVTRTGYVRISNFMSARYMTNTPRTYTVCGHARSRGYAAPEQFLGLGYAGFGVDWWALGCLAFELLAGYPPFYHPDPRVSVELTISGEIMHWPSTIGAHARAFISQLLQPKPHRRLGVIHDSAKLIRSAPWFSTPCTSPVCELPADSCAVNCRGSSETRPKTSVGELLNRVFSTNDLLGDHSDGSSHAENDEKSAFYAEATAYAGVPFSFESLAMQVMPSPLDPGIMLGSDLSMLNVNSYTTDTTRYWKCPEYSASTSANWLKSALTDVLASDSVPLPDEDEHQDATDVDWARLF